MSGIGRAALVLSSGYLPGELWGEIGCTPSAQAPIGGTPVLTRLCQQANEVAAELTVTLPNRDGILTQVAERAGARIIVPAGGSSLAEALGAGLEGVHHEDVTVVFGDTLVDWPAEPDVLLVEPTARDNRWTTVELTEEGDLRFVEKRMTADRTGAAVVGAFRVSRASELLKALREADTDTIWSALRRYHRRFPLSLHSASNWRDLGHLDTYFESRRAWMSARHFNDVQVNPDGRSVTKRSVDRTKLLRELDWFRSLPTRLRWAVPALLAHDDGATPGWYELEYLPSLTLAEALTLGELDEGYWRRVLSAVEDLLRLLHGEVQDASPLVVEAAKRAIYLQKTRSRIVELMTESPFFSAASVLVNQVALPGLPAVIDSLAGRLAASSLLSEPRLTRIHGDLFLGNMFFDRRTGFVKVIDPRGDFGYPGPFGDPLYDVAKLLHSFEGGYDYIVAGLFHSQLAEDRIDFTLWRRRGTMSTDVEDLAKAMLRRYAGDLGHDEQTCTLAQSLLFLSMAALHSDDRERQHVLVARGLELFWGSQ